jgi:hypothetical protein
MEAVHRLAKYYVPFTPEEKTKQEAEIHKIIVNRDPKHSNIHEVRAWQSNEQWQPDDSILPSVSIIQAYISEICGPLFHRLRGRF